MGMNCIFSTPVNADSQNVPFEGVLNVYLFQANSKITEDEELIRKVGKAVRTLSFWFRSVISNISTLNEHFLASFFLSELQSKSLAGVNDKERIILAIKETINASGVSLFSLRSKPIGIQIDNTSQGPFIQGLESTGLIDLAGKSVPPTEAIYDIDNQDDHGLTTSICLNGGRILRLSSTESDTGFDALPIRNKFREKTTSTDFEHRPFIGAPVKGAPTIFADVIGAIRAVRSSEKPPFTKFDEETLLVATEVFRNQFKLWRVENSLSNPQILFSFGARYPFVSTILKGGTDEPALNAARRLASPLPAHSTWNLRQVDAVLEDLVSSLVQFDAFMASVRLMPPDRRSFKVLSVYSRECKNPFGPYEFIDSEIDDPSLGSLSIAEGAILTSSSNTILRKQFPESRKTSQSICLPLTTFHKMVDLSVKCKTERLS